MKLIAVLYISLLSLSACPQNIVDEEIKKTNHIGGPCEGCEAVFESPVNFNKLSWVDTLPDFNEAGKKMMISGVIFKADGKTPAPGVVLFIYHTDQNGEYKNKYQQKGWARRQGYIRGWMKTNEKGQYKFYTLMPASYPNSTAIKHIHATIKEPGKNEYWIDEYIFDGDPFLNAEIIKEHEQRGGSGFIKLTTEDGLLIGERDIYLGRNIPGYPTAAKKHLIKNEKPKNTYPASDDSPLLLSSLIPHWESILR